MEVLRSEPSYRPFHISCYSPLGGAGGATNDPHALRLPAVTLDIDTERFLLKHVAVQPGGHKSSEGTLGLDVLRQGARVILDFRTMQLRIVRS